MAAGISKALGYFPAQMACSSVALQLPRSREQWETEAAVEKPLTALVVGRGGRARFSLVCALFIKAGQRTGSRVFSS